METCVRQAWKGMIPVLAHLTIATVAIAGVVSMQRSRLQQPSITSETPQQAEQQEAARLKVLSQLPSFGFENLIADWTFLNFIQYYGDTPARNQTGVTLSPKYFDIITRRDPRFVDAYLFLSGTVSHQLGQPQVSLEYMQRGMNALSPQMTPRAFVVWRFAALDQILLLGDLPGAARSMEMAANWTTQTAEYRDLSPIFQGTAKFLRSNPDTRLVRFQAWAIVHRDALGVNDKLTLERAKRELLALGGIETIDRDGKPAFILPEALRPKPKSSR